MMNLARFIPERLKRWMKIESNVKNPIEVMDRSHSHHSVEDAELIKEKSDVSSWLNHLKHSVVIEKIISMVSFSPSPQNEKSSTPPIRGAIIFGITVLVVFFGGFGLWSALAPLETAAVATGKVTVDSNRKTIQHLEGGIIKTLHVTEGAKVKAGDVLVTLDDTQAKARAQILESQAVELLAIEARLIAERDEEKKLEWPERILKLKDEPKIKKIIRGQENIFKSDNKTAAGQLAILKKRITQLEKQIESLQAQVDSEVKQEKLVQQEIVALEYLEKKKLVELPRLLAVKRESARLMGNRGEHLGLIAKTEQQIGETEQKIIAIKDERLKKILDTLSETQSKLAGVLEREIAAADVLKRTKIIAPKSGTVVGLQVHTVGGVISPGKTVMDIVPSQDVLVIDAEINPLDIDMVRPGLIAKVRLTVFKQRNTPTLDGKVIRVSPDSFTNEKTGQTYFSVRIVIGKDQLKKYPQLSLYPGMPVQVMIISDTRTALNYFLQPLRDSFVKAFKEQ